jgi:hypothetical protein
MELQTIKNELKLTGWSYLGQCACQPPAHEWRKNKYIIKYVTARDLFNLFNPQRKVVGFGKSDVLFASIEHNNI